MKPDKFGEDVKEIFDFADDAMNSWKPVLEINNEMIRDLNQMGAWLNEMQ